MKIGIYSGMFDPVHLGHSWLIEQASKLFDEVHVVIGPNPAKPYPWFTEEKRKAMLEDTVCFNQNVKISILQEPRLIDYANKLAKEKHHVTILRGVRNPDDYYYENVILKCMRGKACSGIEFMYYYSPEHLSGISSTLIKDWVIKDRWECVEAAVHRIVGKYLVGRRYDDIKDYPNTHPEVVKKYKQASSIFETTTAGFFPVSNIMPCDCFKKESTNNHPSPMDDGMSLQQMASSESEWWTPKYEPNPELEKVRAYFDKAVEYGLVQLPKVLNSQQVSYMLDDCKYDVISSLEYHLMKIPINSVKPTGGRYQSRSTSVGPIIVDRNFFPKDGWHTDFPVLIIEGKHRWLDAVERGEDFIWAWVGDEVLDHFKKPEWIVLQPKVADIHNPAFANFAPHVLETENGGINLQILGSGLADLSSGSVQSVPPEQ